MTYYNQIIDKRTDKPIGAICEHCLCASIILSRMGYKIDIGNNLSAPDAMMIFAKPDTDIYYDETGAIALLIETELPVSFFRELKKYHINYYLL